LLEDIRPRWLKRFRAQSRYFRRDGAKRHKIVKPLEIAAVRPAHYLAQQWLLGANVMRSVLALGLLISLCASANAAKVHVSKPHAGHVRVAQPVATPKGFAVPGWTEEQTRNWLDSYHGGTD
jgi:hypothetical protein